MTNEKPIIMEQGAPEALIPLLAAMPHNIVYSAQVRGMTAEPQQGQEEEKETRYERDVRLRNEAEIRSGWGGTEPLQRNSRGQMIATTVF